jgi:hypothetical protein
MRGTLDLTELRLSCERQARGRKGVGSSHRMNDAGGQTQRFLTWSRSPASSAGSAAGSWILIQSHVGRPGPGSIHDAGDSG